MEVFLTESSTTLISYVHVTRPEGQGLGRSLPFISVVDRSEGEGTAAATDSLLFVISTFNNIYSYEWTCLC